MGAIFIGVLCALFGYGYIRLILKNDNGTLVLILVLICLFFGMMMTVNIKLYITI